MTATATGVTFDHGLRGRLNAWFFEAFDDRIARLTAPLKKRAFSDLRGERVLEIGAGVGANLRYLPAGATLVAVEPNIRMHDALTRRCVRAGVPLELVTASAERMPLPDGSVDEVVCSLVLCTVPDPAAVLAEVRRVLRPGGRFRFVEHVAAEPGSVRSRVQRSIRRPWGWMFEGCDPHRDTAAAIEGAGFAHVSLSRRTLRSGLFYPVGTAISGVATA